MEDILKNYHERTEETLKVIKMIHDLMYVNKIKKHTGLQAMYLASLQVYKESGISWDEFLNLQNAMNKASKDYWEGKYEEVK